MVLQLATASKFLDYAVFIVVLLVSLLIGIYFSFRQKNAEEYVHGSHNLGLWPAAISMIVSYVSALTLQGIPAEVYLYGIEYSFTLVAFLSMPMVTITFLPIFFEMKPTSIYEYLEERFDSTIPQLLANCLSIVKGLMYAGITTFGTSAAIESLTGIPTVYNIVAMTVICMIYTAIGGIKAVIWTDVFQAAIMVIGMVVIIVIGGLKIDIDNMWNVLDRYGRTELHWDVSLAQRSSVWIFLVGIICQRYATFVTQPAMIRYTSVATERIASIAIGLASLGFMLLIILAILVGLVVLTYYADKGCGPLATGEIYSSNQIVPYFVTKVINYPGVPGLFISAITASTLSSISSVYNAVATTFWKDILSKYLKNFTEVRRFFILKFTVLVFSGISMGISFIAMYAGGTLLYAASAAMGVASSPPLGMFVLGASCTFVGSTAVSIGCFLSFVFCAFLALGQMFYGTTWEDPVNIQDMCCQNTNWTLHCQFNDSTMTSPPYTSTEAVGGGQLSPELEYLFSISAYFYPVIGPILTVVIALMLSAVPCLRHKSHVDPKLLFKFVRKYHGKPTEEYQKKDNKETFSINTKF